MTALLTAAAIVATFVLLLSALGAAARGTPRDPYPRGPWGVLRWTSTRDRALDPHERRWQTSILSARDNTSRWRDLVAEIETLEHTGGIAQVAPAPPTFDRKWIEAGIANLESGATRHHRPGEPNP